MLDSLSNVTGTLLNDRKGLIPIRNHLDSLRKKILRRKKERKRERSQEERRKNEMKWTPNLQIQVFEHTRDPTLLRASFKNLSLKKIKRRDTKNDEVFFLWFSASFQWLLKLVFQVVTEEKFAMVFHCSFTVGDLNFCVYALSNPLVVIVHGNQQANASATILWDNFFREKVWILDFVNEKCHEEISSNLREENPSLSQKSSHGNLPQWLWTTTSQSQMGWLHS